MNLNSLTAISPIDGRYRATAAALSPYLSEWGLIKYRVKVEVEYFIRLCQILPQLAELNSSEVFSRLRLIYEKFDEKDALWIKEREKVTNHDIKAVEYFLKDKLEQSGYSDFIEFVHFGLTSQDINNTAIPLSLKDALNAVILPEIDNLMEVLRSLTESWKEVVILARTHGQPASPTRLGKEMDVFYVRMQLQLSQLLQIPHSSKFGGATGNMNAHFAAYPNTDWHQFANEFTETLGLKRSFPTTQIEHYDNLAAQCDALKRLNTILIDLCRDIWTYISFDYFKQALLPGEIGSSAMPHKVNPIDFENAEGNLMLANSQYEFFAAKLPISRLQRDLTDSTVLRNLGMPLAHSLIAFRSVMRGLKKLILNAEKIESDLNNNWAVVAEAIQNILRREQVEKPYELLKDLTRTHEGISKASIHQFIQGLSVSDELKRELMNITPFNFVGK